MNSDDLLKDFLERRRKLSKAEPRPDPTQPFATMRTTTGDYLTVRFLSDQCPLMVETPDPARHY